MKTRDFRPSDKLIQVFLSILAGCAYLRENYLVAGALWLLLTTVCIACQMNSPAPASMPTTSSTPTPIPSSDEPFTCQSYETSEYVLPFPVGIAYTCIQGYVRRTYHVEVFEYSVDFDMPMRSTITAAREGRVIFVEANHFDYENGMEKANVVIVQHDDGTYGRYIHLTKDGALVKVGQRVTQGDPIGLSGSSGDPGMPHLHFDVTQDCPRSNCHTIPICFKNTKPHPAGLATSESYTAEPY